MNFDYQQTQTELTYQLSGIGGWELKKVTSPRPLEGTDGLENESFQTQMALMTGSGWALVSMAAIAGPVRQRAFSGGVQTQTSSYDLHWKRLKQTP